MPPAHFNPTVKHDALLLFDAVDSNPNGDPDNAGKPRTDMDTQEGIVSDASLKRKIRDSVEFQVREGMLTPSERFGIFIRRGVSLNEQLDDAYEQLGQKGVDKPGSKEVANAQAYMKDHYYDVRIFGAVMTTGKSSAGKLTGPVTVGIGRSLDPVLPMDLGITRTASTQKEKKDNASQMGSKTVIPYGLYAARIHYQPTKDNRVTEQDLEVLWSTITTMFEVTRSAARPDVNVRGLFLFSHTSPLGNAPARALLDSVRVNRRTPDQQNVAKFDDYEIIEPCGTPTGVIYTRLV